VGRGGGLPASGGFRAEWCARTGGGGGGGGDGVGGDDDYVDEDDWPWQQSFRRRPPPGWAGSRLRVVFQPPRAPVEPSPRRGGPPRPTPHRVVLTHGLATDRTTIYDNVI